MANETLLELWIAGFEQRHGVKPSPELEAQMIEKLDRRVLPVI